MINILQFRIFYATLQILELKYESDEIHLHHQVGEPRQHTKQQFNAHCWMDYRKVLICVALLCSAVLYRLFLFWKMFQDNIHWIEDRTIFECCLYKLQNEMAMFISSSKCKVHSIEEQVCFNQLFWIIFAENIHLP